MTADRAQETSGACVTGRPRIIHSPWLGEVESNPEAELFFPAGLPGFEAHRNMVAIEIPSQRPVVYLQSLDSDDVCFAALPVYVIDPSFRLSLNDDDRDALQFSAHYEPAIGDEVLCLVLLRKSGRTVEANMESAIVINLRNRRGVQCVPRDGTAAPFRLCPDNGWRREC